MLSDSCTAYWLCTLYASFRRRVGQPSCPLWCCKLSTYFLHLTLFFHSAISDTGHPIVSQYHLTYIIWVNQFRFSAIFINTLRVHSKVLSVQPHQYYVTIMKRVKPTRCYTMVYWTLWTLNIFRALLCPSSGACDYTDGLGVWLLTLVMAGCWSGVWL